MASINDPNQNEKVNASVSTNSVLEPTVGRIRTVRVIKKAKKKRYSKGLKDLQKFEDGLSKSARRISRALASGLTTYRKRRNKSASKRRDGAIRDGLVNWSKGLGKTLRKASDAPYDIAKSVNSKKITRELRRAFRFITR
ncbi:MAG: hypothetical protein AB1489_34200 [Acidobacteriota bacterium]